MSDKEHLEAEDIKKEAAPEDIQEEQETPAEEPEKAEDSSADVEVEKEEPAPAEDNDARYMRLAADFQNYKRRVEKEKSDIYQYANEKIALDIIEVMDNFDRALGHESTDAQFAEGVTLIYKQLKGVLDKHNIIEIPAVGQEFDPNFHNAVMTEDNPDFESGYVTEAFQKGYTLNGKVIRPSMVKVAQ